jgi:hypothetical protein
MSETEDLESALLRMEQMVAALKWNPSLHPRGRDGTFIEAGGWVRGLFTWRDGAKKATAPEAARVIGFSEDTDNPGDPFVFVETGAGRTGWARASEVEQAVTPKARLPTPRPPAKPGEMILRSQAEANRAAEKPGFSVIHRKPAALAPADIAEIQRQATPAVRVTNVDDAVRELSAGHKIELQQPSEVSTLLDRLAEIVNDAKARGEAAPTYDLCNVTVPGTNLFCVESKGIKRVKMPQLSGVPLPGSRADALPKNAKGEVDLGPHFREHLETLGYAVTDKDVRADHLRASQSQLNGGKIAGMSRAVEAGTLPPGRIFTSNDDYVVDGHHRWAANVVEDLKDNEPGDITMPVTEIDADIITVLAAANDFAADWGIPQAGVGAGVGAAPTGPPPLTAADLSNPDTPRSREVSAEEFLNLAEIGHARLAAIRSRPVAPTEGVLDASKWLTIRNDSWATVQEEWGGATIEAATGVPITGKPKRYAMSVKPPGVETVSIPIGSDRASFDTAMEEARTRFATELSYPQYHLGVFRDEDTGQIDIDPVLVVDNLEDVESIGAYARSVGGAYSFADGNGYWPPHVAAGAPVAASIERRLAALEAIFSTSR